MEAERLGTPDWRVICQDRATWRGVCDAAIGLEKKTNAFTGTILYDDFIQQSNFPGALTHRPSNVIPTLPYSDGHSALFLYPFAFHVLSPS